MWLIRNRSLMEEIQRLNEVIKEKDKTIDELERMFGHISMAEMMKLAVMRSIELKNKGIVQ